MAIQRKTPGVYIEEVPSFPPSIVAVQTAVPAFIGFTEKANRGGKDLDPFTPVKVASIKEYTDIFGTAQAEEHIIVDIVKAADGSNRYVVKFDKANGAELRSKHNLYYAVQLFFANGPDDCFCYIISTGSYGTLGAPISDATPFLNALDELAKQDEPTLIVIPEGQNIETDTYFQILQEGLKQCESLGDRFSIMDLQHSGEGLSTSDDLFRDLPNDPQNNGPVNTFRSKIGGNEDQLKYGAVYFPNLLCDFNYVYDEAKVVVNENNTPTTIAALNNIKKLAVKAAIDNFSINMPPSAAIAGVYASVDKTRGVFKAPANVTLSAVSGLTFKITDAIQNDLNVDDNNGKSINGIRFFTGAGFKVWGARTLDGNSNEWRYINVRRYFNMVEESTKKATMRFVFEPNDANTWTTVKGMITNFLLNQWSTGALFGAKPEQAFFVHVGLGQTMTAQEILEGYLIIEIGLAVVRPAEFIILRFSHKLPE